MRVELKSVVVEVDGELSVTISGMYQIPVWCADNSHTHQMVRHSIKISMCFCSI